MLVKLCFIIISRYLITYHTYSKHGSNQINEPQNLQVHPSQLLHIHHIRSRYVICCPYLENVPTLIDSDIKHPTSETTPNNLIKLLLKQTTSPTHSVSLCLMAFSLCAMVSSCIRFCIIITNIGKGSRGQTITSSS